MSQTVRFQETLRKLAMIDEGFVEDQAGLGLGLAGTSALHPKTAALLQLGASVATGAPPVCVAWSTGRALAAGATDEEIADALLAIAPVTGSAGWSAPRPTWRPRSGMTSRPRWTTRADRGGSQSRRRSMARSMASERDAAPSLW